MLRLCTVGCFLKLRAKHQSWNIKTLKLSDCWYAPALQKCTQENQEFKISMGHLFKMIKKVKTLGRSWWEGSGVRVLAAKPYLSPIPRLHKIGKNFWPSCMLPTHKYVNVIIKKAGMLMQDHQDYIRPLHWNLVPPREKTKVRLLIFQPYSVDHLSISCFCNLPKGSMTIFLSILHNKMTF